MKIVHRIKCALAMATVAMASISSCLASETGTTAQGLDYVSGGVGSLEQQALQDRRNDFNFWMTTAARRTGAYLSGAHVQILDARTRQVVLEHTLDGPWLLAQLKPGRYAIEITYREGADAPEQTVKKRTVIGSGKQHRQMFIYFNSADESRRLD